MRVRKDRTTVWVKIKTWNKLNDLKDDPKDTFDSIINDLLDKVKK